MHSGYSISVSVVAGSVWNLYRSCLVNLFLFVCFIMCFVLFVLFCFVLFCFVLFCFVLFCFVLFCFVLFCFVLFCLVLFCFVLFCVLLVRISVVKDIQQGTYMRSLHALVSSSATYGYHTALYMCFNVVSLQLPFLFIPATCTSSNEYLHVTQHKALSTSPNQCMQPVLLTFTTIAQTSFMNTIWEVPILTV